MDTIQTLVSQLTQSTPSMEAQLLQPRLIRTLYKELGEPTPTLFPEPYSKVHRYTKVRGYTTAIETTTTQEMQAYNTAPTVYRINRPSPIKLEIVDRYTRDGWHTEVRPYIVTASKLVPHPQHENIAVLFTVTRDNATYEYCIIDDND